MRWLLAVLAAGPAFACGEGVPMVAETPSALSVHATVPDPLPLAQPFRMQIQFCGDSTVPLERVTVDATMPAHQHGMNFRVDLAEAERNRFEVSNVVFHMPGLWEIRVEAEIDGRRYAYRAEVPLR